MRVVAIVIELKSKYKTSTNSHTAPKCWSYTFLLRIIINKKVNDMLACKYNKTHHKQFQYIARGDRYKW